MSFQGSVNQALSSLGSAAAVKKILHTEAIKANTAAKEVEIKAAQQQEAERKRLADIEQLQHKTEVGERELFSTLTRKREEGEHNIGQKRVNQAEQIVSNYEKLYRLDPSEINKQALKEARTRSIAVASAIGRDYRSKAIKDLAAQIGQKYPDLIKQQEGGK